MTGLSAIVVGAGVFGGALARRLAQEGWQVTLVEQHAPGHVRAASGGESQLMRFAHADEPWYTRLAWRARELWRELEREAGVELIAPSGLAWFAHRENGWEHESERTLREHAIPVERLDPDAAASLYPSLATDDLAFVLLEPEAGILHARRATQALVASATAEGAVLVAGRGRPAGGTVELDGRRLEADRVVWACGAWMPRVFPDLVTLDVTRQDYFYFGANAAWATPPTPGFVDYDHAFYGHGDLDGRGVKVASTARARHPEHEGVWLLGGDSGHGFKHGRALAEYVAGRDVADPRFGLEARRTDRGLRTAGAGAAVPAGAKAA